MARITVNVNFEHDDLEAARKFVEGWKLPDGATVTISESNLVGGEIKKGKLVEPTIELAE